MERHPLDLFFHASFSIKKERLPEMRERLRELLLEYIDGEQSDDGNQVQQLTLGFYK